MAEADRAQQMGGLRELLGVGSAKDLLETGALALSKRPPLPSEDEEAQTEPDMSPQELLQAERFSAILEASFLVAASDGVLAASEEQQLRASILELTDNRIPEEDISQLLEAFLERLRSDGYEARIAQVAEILDQLELRRAAFLMALGLAHIDGRVQEEEAATFQELARAFGFSEAEATELSQQVSDWLARTLPPQ